MKQLASTLCFLLSTGLAQHAWSATKVVSISRSKQPLEIVINNNMARFNSGQKTQYQLIDLANNKNYNVNLAQKIAIDMSIPDAPIPKNVKLPQVNLKKIGKGPKVSGYPTTQYQLFANGKLCETFFVSPKAGKIPDIQALIKAMAAMANASKGAMLSVGATPCRIASTQVFGKFEQLGALMKSVTVDGAVSMEIKSIDTTFAADASYFTLPKGVEVLTMQEMMAKMQERIKLQLQRTQ